MNASNDLELDFSRDMPECARGFFDLDPPVLLRATFMASNSRTVEFFAIVGPYGFMPDCQNFRHRSRQTITSNHDLGFDRG